MPLFSYKGRNARGSLIQGEIDSGTIDSVASQLFNIGVTPIDIKEQKAASDSDISFSNYLNRKAPSLDDLILFSRQMFTLMKAGVPMIKSITGLIQSSRNFKIIEANMKMTSAIPESIDNLRQDIDRLGKLFANIYGKQF